jgi:REP element-mobilizing transposase RayT
MNGLIRSSHSVGEANYHLQFTPAYRRGVFEDETVKVLTRDYMIMAGRKHGITIGAFGFGPDHCHVFVVACKNHSVAHAAKILKGFSSYMMRKHHTELFSNMLWGDKFWSAGFFYRTVGAVNATTVEKYVKESQGKHFGPKEETYVKSAQKNLINFSS